MKWYVGKRESRDGSFRGEVAIHVELINGYTQPLAPRFDLETHSPDGFEWSYPGSGPAQLALAILADATGEDDLARELYQSFKHEVIATLPREGFRLSKTQVCLWAETHRAPKRRGSITLEWQELGELIARVTDDLNQVRCQLDAARERAQELQRENERLVGVAVGAEQERERVRQIVRRRSLISDALLADLYGDRPRLTLVESAKEGE